MFVFLLCALTAGTAYASSYALTDGVPVTSSVSQFEFKYYSFIAYDQPAFQFILTSLGSTGQQVDLYVGNGYEPDLQNYLYKNASKDTTKVITVAADGSTKYIAGVYGFTADSFAIEASSNVPEISPNVQYPGSVDNGQYKYYQFYCPQNVADMVLVNAQQSYDTDIYVSVGHLPSTSDYDWKNTASSGTNCITLTYPESGQYYIGMYGYSGTTSSYILQLKYNTDKKCSLVGVASNTTQAEPQPARIVLKEVLLKDGAFWPKEEEKP